MNEAEPSPEAAARPPVRNASLPEVNRSVVVPVTASFWRKLFAFSGPGFLIAVGYMDPGNWATDLAGGAQFGYTPDVRRPAVQLHGHPAATPEHQAGRGHGTRSGPSLPRPLFHAHGVVSLDSLRNRHRRLRFGGGGRLGHRAAIALRPAAGLGVHHHRRGCGGGAVFAIQRISLY